MPDILYNPKYAIAYGRAVYVVADDGEIKELGGAGWQDVTDPVTLKYLRRRIEELEDLK